jgi:hypothetical protein
MWASRAARRDVSVTSRYFVAAILAIFALGLAACGGGGGEGEVAEPTAAGTVEQPTAAPIPTAASTPTITGNLFEYPERGYSVEFPDGWTPQPNFLPAADFSVDAFFAPDEVNGIQPNISVTCEAPPEGMSLQDYFNKKVDVIRQVVKVEPDVRSRQVSGQEAMISDYSREKDEPKLEKMEAVFITDKCAWSIAMTVPSGGGTTYQDMFNAFLDSFTLLP